MTKKRFYSNPDIEVISLIPEGIIAESSNATSTSPILGDSDTPTGEYDWGF